MTAAADDTRRPSSWGVATAFLMIYLAWGTTYYVTGVAMKEIKMPPALFGGTRFLGAGTILLLWQAGRGQARLSLGEFFRLIPASVFLFLLGNWLINLGQRHIDSGLAAILIASTPLWIGLFGMAWPGGERLHGKGWIGLVLGFAGVIITMAPHTQGQFDPVQGSHALLVLASAACWAIGAILARRLVLQAPHLTSAAYQMLLGGVMQTTLGTLLGEWPDFVARADGRALLAYLYLLFVGSLIGFVAFNWLLVHVSAAKVGTYAYVNPIIAVFIGWIMSDTRVDEWLLAGFAVVLLGVYLVRSDHTPSQEVELEPD